MKCSECGGGVLSFQYSMYHTDGSSSGYYRCQDCGKRKDWFVQGAGEPVIDMKERQCSALVDINNKKICEGDLVEEYHRGHLHDTFVVTFPHPFITFMAIPLFVYCIPTKYNQGTYLQARKAVIDSCEGHFKILRQMVKK